MLVTYEFCYKNFYMSQEVFGISFNIMQNCSSTTTTETQFYSDNKFSLTIVNPNHVGNLGKKNRIDKRR